MSNTPDLASCIDSNGDGPGRMLPVDPYRSLRVHFGMLLGVDDFETMDAYHRGKMWLHSAWLHREGAVWGLDVRLDLEHGEIRVLPGLALDGAGRELHLEADACLNLSRWFEEHQDDAELTVATLEDGSVQFDAHVVIQFQGCLTRQVPALVEPCDGSGTTTAYSRVFETVELLLRPGKAPERGEPSRPLPYHRLRLLFGLDDPIREDPDDSGSDVVPSDQEVLDQREAILGLPAEEQPPACLAAFRRFAALDQIDLGPASAGEGDDVSLFPLSDPAPLVLADVLGISLQPAEQSWILTDGQVDTTVRSAHVATSTIQELLCGPPCGEAEDAGEEPPSGEEPAGGGNGDGEEPAGEEAPTGFARAHGDEADAGGPRVDPASVEVAGETVQFAVTSSLSQNSVDARAFSISSFDKRDGWRPEAIKTVNYNRERKLVTLELRDAPGGNLVRIIARGTGESPLLGTDLVPLAGVVNGPPGTPHDGNDFVFMLKLRS